MMYIRIRGNATVKWLYTANSAMYGIYPIKVTPRVEISLLAVKLSLLINKSDRSIREWRSYFMLMMVSYLNVNIRCTLE